MKTVQYDILFIIAIYYYLHDFGHSLGTFRHIINNLIIFIRIVIVIRIFCELILYIIDKK